MTLTMTCPMCVVLYYVLLVIFIVISGTAIICFTARVYEIPYPYVPYANFEWGWSYWFAWIGCVINLFIVVVLLYIFSCEIR